MKFSENWLREWVNPAISTQQLVDQITMAGLEVDEVQPVAGAFSDVVVARINAAEPHPNADKLQVCQVDDGTETFQVVCGAPNARAGLVTAFARVGAKLPTPDGGEFKIKKAKLRQVESFGMLCAPDELGISDDHGGIMELAADAPLGTCLRDYLNLNDTIIDVDLTPNRGDCLGIKGLAREVGVLNKMAVTAVAIEPVSAQSDVAFPVTLAAPKACPRYLGRVIQDVDMQASTPLWMVEKLRRSGIRAIDPVVDVTNYVLLELGQPLHAFDLDKLESGIVVRMARPGETLTLLDGNEVNLTEETLVIADSKGPLAMAGIFGGAASGVTANTRHIFLECAYFDQIAIAGKARAYGLHTDASHRYERGVDWQLQQQAIERATALLLEIVGGKPGPVVAAVSEPDLPAVSHITLRQEKVNALLACVLPSTEIEQILTRLGMQLRQQGDGVWKVAVPSYRFDISLEVDLIEELARVYGYNNLPVKMPTTSLSFTSLDETRVGMPALRRTLTALGYQEAITYSFIETGLQQLFDDHYQALALANPISAEMAVMRTSLWPGLVKALQYNQNRQQTRVRLFETGQRFLPEPDGLIQQNVLAGLLSGPRDPERWTGKSQPIDFYDIKGDLEALLALGSAASEYQFSVAKHCALHPGQSAKIERQGQTVGYVGALHPALIKKLNLNGPVYLFEISLDTLRQGRLACFDELSRFPESRRDLALLVDEQVPYAAIKDIVVREGGEFLKSPLLFDVYQGQGIESGRKSLALGLTWQHPSRTLNDDEINAAVQQIIDALSASVGATLRD